MVGIVTPCMCILQCRAWNEIRLSLPFFEVGCLKHVQTCPQSRSVYVSVLSESDCNLFTVTRTQILIFIFIWNWVCSLWRSPLPPFFFFLERLDLFTWLSRERLCCATSFSGFPVHLFTKLFTWMCHCYNDPSYTGTQREHRNTSVKKNIGEPWFQV
jgi:hypothetical protein